MATPGSVSETSRRDSAKAPAKPVTSAAMRSGRCGDVRIMIRWIASGWVTHATPRRPAGDSLRQQLRSSTITIDWQQNPPLIQARVRMQLPIPPSWRCCRHCPRR